MSQHTPGPWAAVEGHRNIHILSPGRRGKQLVAPVEKVVGYDADPTPEAWANARLIAAAPELLAACAMVLDDPGLTSAANDVIRAAVAKATGGA